MAQPSLRPQDVVVLAKLIARVGPRPSFAQLGAGLSCAGVDAAVAIRHAS
ncbi:MAG TPA: hypothetical protein VN700_01910 [Vicinamibacterales bacterium]|nr:hypothetical protein [Vicinamibacterales bacterium]